MNAKTFVSNVEGDVQRMEITELETSTGRTVRIMFEDERMDNIMLRLANHRGTARVLVGFYNQTGYVDEVVGHHNIGWDRRE